ncbi:MAG: hypothetical protein ACE5F1_00680 [Planctomycetota bacterium]
MPEREDQELIEVLRRRKETGNANEKKPAEILEEWKKTLVELFRQLEGWLKEEAEEKLLSYDRTPMTLTEELLGTYDVEQLVIRFTGGDVVVVRPVARMVVGANARVDVLAGPRREMLIRGEDHWSIGRPTAKQARTPLDASRFKSLLLDLISSPE